MEICLGVGSQPLPTGCHEPPSTARIPLITDVREHPWSLVALSEHLERLGHLPWVTSALPPNPDFEPMLLRLDEEEKELLEHLFAGHLHYDITDYQASLKLAAHRKKPRVSLKRNQDALTELRVGFECATLQGVLIFHAPVDETDPSPGSAPGHTAVQYGAASLTLLFEH